MNWDPIIAVVIFMSYTFWLQKKLERMHLQFKADNKKFLEAFEKLSKK